MMFGFSTGVPGEQFQDTRKTAPGLQEHYFPTPGSHPQDIAPEGKFMSYSEHFEDFLSSGGGHSMGPKLGLFAHQMTTTTAFWELFPEQRLASPVSFFGGCRVSTRFPTFVQESVMKVQHTG